MSKTKNTIIIEENHSILKEEPSINTAVKNFFNEKGLRLPSYVQIKMDYEVDNNEPWEYLKSIIIDGEYRDKENLENELKDFINDNFSISDMKEHKRISFV